MLYRCHQGLAKCQLPLSEVVMLLKIIIFIMMIIMVIIIIVLIILRRIANKHNISSDNSNSNNHGSQQCQMNFLICEKRRLRLAWNKDGASYCLCAHHLRFTQ